MKKIKITKAELEMVQEAADRLARRSGERIVLNRDRLEVVDANGQLACGWFFAALLVATGIGIGLLLRGI
jgi:hypothetical protein